MAYEVTATRRRPQSFDSLAGQEFVAETLRNTIRSGKIAHAYLFAGPRGCGKTSTSRILAKALNCVHGPTPNPCGECEQCREITKGSSADVIEIDGASNTSVEDIRKIKEEVLFAPQSAKFKIYIIDEVHMLSTSAFNALLKTIEEPPEYVVFVFATTELQKVPATIKSRCQQFNFRLVPIETVEKLLAAAAAEIGIKADEEALFWIARESTGSIRDAYTLFDQVAAFSSDHITYEKIRDKLGLVGVDRLNTLFEDCAAGRAGDAILKLDEFLSGGISIEQFIVNAADYFRSLLLIKNGITKESLLGQSADRFSQSVISAWKSVQIERAISLLLQLYRDIRYSLSPRFELELAISRLSWLGEYVSPAEVKKAIDQTKNLLISPIAAAQNPNMPKNLSTLMNPTTWQRGAKNANENPAAQTIAPKKPLPVLDALKNLPEYKNSRPISENFSKNPPPSQIQKEIPVEIKKTAEFPSDEDLQKFVFEKLSVKHAVLASKLAATRNWRRKDNSIFFEVSTDFEVADFEKKRKEFLAAFCELFGAEVNFFVSLKKNEVVDLKATAPESVRILCDNFRGEIVSVEEKTPDSAESQNGADGGENEEDEEIADVSLLADDESDDD